MAYDGGKKPHERASKNGHSHLVTESVRRVLREMESYDDEAVVSTPEVQHELHRTSPSSRYERVVAIDGSFARVPAGAGSVAFISIGAVAFEMGALRELATKRLLDSEDLGVLKGVERWVLALPVVGMRRRGSESVRDSFRLTLHEAMGESDHGAPLYDAMEWLLRRGWLEHPESVHVRCVMCDEENFLPPGLTAVRCEGCDREVFLVDSLGLHVAVEQGREAASNVMTMMEQLVLVHLYLRYHEDLGALERTLFIKDGPLSFFKLRVLSEPMVEYARWVRRNGHSRRLSMIGFTKSGYDVRTAVELVERYDVQPGSVVLNAGSAERDEAYARESHWGAPVVIRNTDGAIFAASVPTGRRKRRGSAYEVEDYLNLEDIAATLGELVCTRYDDALLPIALINELVSISTYPGERMLANLLREEIGVN